MSRNLLSFHYILASVLNQRFNCLRPTFFAIKDQKKCRQVFIRVAKLEIPLNQLRHNENDLKTFHFLRQFFRFFINTKMKNAHMNV